MGYNVIPSPFYIYNFFFYSVLFDLFFNPINILFGREQCVVSYIKITYMHTQTHTGEHSHKLFLQTTTTKKMLDFCSKLCTAESSCVDVGRRHI